MEIQKLLGIYARHPKVKALAKALQDKWLTPEGEGRNSPRTIRLAGLQGSQAPLVFASLVERAPQGYSL